MSAVVVIGKTLADAQGYADKHGLVGAALISPQSFHARFEGLLVDRFYVTRHAFQHPSILPTVLTVQRFMRKQTSGG